VTHDPLPTVTAERSQIAWVFQSLIGNAIKYRSPSRPPKIHVSARPEEKYWVVAVEDNGVGFAQEYAEAIFTPFKRLYGQEYSFRQAWADRSSIPVSPRSASVR
jgi:light-regulated signal transduction histidine kinase (bacteriophytochrome)